MKYKLSGFFAAASILLGGVATSPAHASTVVCPGALGVPVPGGNPATRQIEVTGALATGECYFQQGNFQGDDVSAYLGTSYTLIEKDVAPNGTGTGLLRYSGATSGTWAMGSNLWASYAEVFIGFHFGNGGGDPDSFLVELDPTATNGTWRWLPTSTNQSLSNIYFFGRGVGTDGPGGNPVPEPASLALVGAALLGLAASRRRRAK